ncbi:MAG: hypothetical protein A2V52_02870 [Actinobacteria bacterium RBG_19FT_COMBO_54_7]|nr:MAG: hypothetical protein A2V52_02870 [Actinobacteria bacterium RBG_19FT_COMBO_54_7]
MFKDMLARYGVTLHQFHLLLHIRSSGHVKVTELSDKMLVSLPTASRMINSLCDLGLINKKKSAGDRRSTYLELTKKGEKVLADIHRQQKEMITKVLEVMPDEDMEIFLKVMEGIAEQWMALMKERAPVDGELTHEPIS